jgi:hypothetical protein
VEEMAFNPHSWMKILETGWERNIDPVDDASSGSRFVPSLDPEWLSDEELPPSATRHEREERIVRFPSLPVSSPPRLSSPEGDAIPLASVEPETSPTSSTEGETSATEGEADQGSRANIGTRICLQNVDGDQIPSIPTFVRVTSELSCEILIEPLEWRLIGPGTSCTPSRLITPR